MATQTTRYDGDLESLNRKAELLQERIGLLQRLREIELEENGNGVVVPNGTAPVTATTATVALQPAKKKQGRPPKAAATVKAGVPAGDGKTVDLPTLLETIGQQVNKPLVLADFVTLVREAGYTTKAKDFSNMVYQALLKLVKRVKFKKNDETRCYEYVHQKAA